MGWIRNYYWRSILITIKGSMNPTVINTVDGTFAVSGSNWVDVPVGPKLKNIKWVNTSPKIKKSKPMSWKVKEYTVIFIEDF